MNSRRKNSVRRICLLIGAGIVLVLAAVYFLSGTSDTAPAYVASQVSSTTISTTIAAASSSSAAQIDTTDWQTFTSYELGFSIQYPPDVTVDTSNPAVFSVAFPRATYFSTVYADDVSVAVAVNATCTPIIAGSTVVPTVEVTIGGVNFTKDETSDIGAGNIYDTVLYDALNNNVCYQITVVDHHANGAGLYESDPTQIAALTAARDSDYAHVSAIVQAMISSFAFVNTPAGENEADYSASGATTTAVATTSIFISTVSPSALSVGDKLTIIGQGFSSTAAAGSAGSGQPTLVQISNGSVQGVLWSGLPTSDTAITATVPTKVCTIYVGESGAACPSYLILNPGTYTVDVSNQNGTTDTVYVTIQ